MQNNYSFSKCRTRARFRHFSQTNNSFWFLAFFDSAVGLCTSIHTCVWLDLKLKVKLFWSWIWFKTTHFRKLTIDFLNVTSCLFYLQLPFWGQYLCFCFLFKKITFNLSRGMFFVRLFRTLLTEFLLNIVVFTGVGWLNGLIHVENGEWESHRRIENLNLSNSQYEHLYNHSIAPSRSLISGGHANKMTIRDC